MAHYAYLFGMLLSNKICRLCININGCFGAAPSTPTALGGIQSDVDSDKRGKPGENWVDGDSSIVGCNIMMMAVRCDCDKLNRHITIVNGTRWHNTRLTMSLFFADDNKIISLRWHSIHYHAFNASFHSEFDAVVGTIVYRKLIKASSLFSKKIQ